MCEILEVPWPLPCNPELKNKLTHKALEATYAALALPPLPKEPVKKESSDG